MLYFYQHFSYLLLCVKVKPTLEQATKAHRGSTNIALLSFNFGARWGEWSKPRPGHFTSRNDPVLIVQGAGWPQCRSGRLRIISPPHCPLSCFCRNQQLSLIWEKRSVIITRQIWIYISRNKIYLVCYYFYISIRICTATCRINGHGSMAWRRVLYFLIYALLLIIFFLSPYMVKVKVNLQQTTKAISGSTSIALLFL